MQKLAFVRICRFCRIVVHVFERIIQYKLAPVYFNLAYTQYYVELAVVVYVIKKKNQ